MIVVSEGVFMESTLLYVEMIIIGIETFIWMCMFFINIIGNKSFTIIFNVLNNLTSSLILIGCLYIIGILMDRLSDIVFENTENKIRKKSGLEAKTTMLIWESADQEKYFDYTRSRIRIVRASIINIPLIAISILWYLGFKSDLTLYIILIGTIFFWISWKSYCKTLKSYYNKARLLELNLKCRNRDNE